MARGVVRVPDQHARHGAVHSKGHETCHGEAHLGGFNMGDDGVACDGDGEHAEHDDSTKLEAVGQEGNKDCWNVGDLLEFCYFNLEDCSY